MRISYWSSDVCSSDLRGGGCPHYAVGGEPGGGQAGGPLRLPAAGAKRRRRLPVRPRQGRGRARRPGAGAAGRGGAARRERTSVEWGKRVSERVEVWRVRSIKIKRKTVVPYSV